jgi:hypothetical protein
VGGGVSTIVLALLEACALEAGVVVADFAPPEFASVAGWQPASVRTVTTARAARRVIMRFGRGWQINGSGLFRRPAG